MGKIVNATFVYQITGGCITRQMWRLPSLRQIYFSVFAICHLFVRSKFVSSVGLYQSYGRSCKLYVVSPSDHSVLNYFTLTDDIDMSLHTRKYPKLLHVGVFPLHPPLGKHLLTAGPTIAYPGLQRYLTYSPAQ